MESKTIDRLDVPSSITCFYDAAYNDDDKERRKQIANEQRDLLRKSLPIQWNELHGRRHYVSSYIQYRTERQSGERFLFVLASFFMFRLVPRNETRVPPSIVFWCFGLFARLRKSTDCNQRSTDLRVVYKRFLFFYARISPDDLREFRSESHRFVYTFTRWK